jgi:hypothetical protein
VCRCAIVPTGGQRNALLGIPQIKPPPAAHVKSPKGREIPPWKYLQTPLVGLGGASSVQVATAEPRHIGTAAAARAAGAELPQHPLPVGPPWGSCNKHQIKCEHWGHHFRAKVPRVGAVTWEYTMRNTQNGGVRGISGKHQRIHLVFPTGYLTPGSS